jgi:hypothetical protein
MPVYRLTTRNSRITDNFIKKAIGKNLEISSYTVEASGINSEIGSCNVGDPIITEHFLGTEKPLKSFQITKLKRYFDVYQQL